MVNRAELVEKAARTSHRWGLDFGGEHAEWDELRESTRREYREEAAAVVEALLPQVTTVVIDGDGIGWERGMDGWYSPGVNYSKMTRYVADQGPLTVVWQP